jgi:hypothetical protein
MGRYSVVLTRTASTSLSVGNITADATVPRRLKLYDWAVSAAEATPADNGFLWQLQRCTTAGSGTSVTPQIIDPADAAALFDAAQAHTVDPTLTANAILWSLGLNQRAAFRWVPPPGGELVVPATANNGLALRTPTASAVAVSATLYVEEQ